MTVDRLNTLNEDDKVCVCITDWKIITKHNNYWNRCIISLGRVRTRKSEIENVRKQCLNYLS